MSLIQCRLGLIPLFKVYSYIKPKMFIMISIALYYTGVLNSLHEILEACRKCDLIYDLEGNCNINLINSLCQFG